MGDDKLESGFGKAVRKVSFELGPSVEDLKQSHPERFDHATLGRIWQACYDQNKERIPSANALPTRKLVINYNYDKLLFRAEIKACDLWVSQAPCVQLCIRLSNDGYMYSPNKELTPLFDKVKWDNRKGWAVLDLQVVTNHFTPIFDFVEDWFSGNDQYTPESALYTLYYNYDERRMDLKAMAEEVGLSVMVCFEPGLPETPVQQYAKRVTKGLIAT